METVVTTIVNKTEEEKTKEVSHGHVHAGPWEDSLRNHSLVLHIGEFQGQEVSLWDLLFSQYVPETQREGLLMKYRSGILSIPEMIVVLTPLLTETEGPCGEATEEASSPTREGTQSQADGAPPSLQDDELERALRLVTIDVPVGEFQGNKRSVWELLFSKYVTTDKRHELLERYRAGSVTPEELVQIITTLIEEMEKSNQLKFSGLRRQVTASELFSSQIIDRDTLSELSHGTKTVGEVKEMESVKRYLEGTSCIAGVLVPSKSDPLKMEKMTIYQAMWKGILRPGTALVLLEAQAATGFITDPLKNEKLSVDEAVSAELVGSELQEKLLSAERAVTGYNDHYTGNKISLFQAMKKGFIVKDHGIRLLEAQIATGGIIDPVHSHRLPVEVAYERGYFDQEMNQILSDPTDDTKGFFDPNTYENLTYMQLRNRCLPDPDTGLLMLQVMDKGSFSFHLSENTRKTLQSAKTRVGVGLFQGQEVSLWDLLFSRYIPSHKRQEVLRQYKAGTISLEDIKQILITIITETEERSTKQTEHKQAPSLSKAMSPTDDTTHPNLEENWQKALKSTAINMPAGEHHGQTSFVWDLLFSSYVSEEKRTELLGLYRRGLLPMDRLISVLTTLVTKKEATSKKFDIKVRRPDQDMATSGKSPVVSSPDTGNWDSPLRTQPIEVLLPEFQDQQLSAWDLLFSHYISECKREELLSKYRKGRLTLVELTQILTALLTEATTRGGKPPTTPDMPSPDTDSSEKEEGAKTLELSEKEKALKSRMVEVTAAEFHGRKVSVWEVLHSKYIPEEKRKELLQLYKFGILTIDQMETVVTTIVNKTEEEKTKEVSHGHVHAGSWEDTLKNHTVVLHISEFRGQDVSLWDLLFSQYISDSKREELLGIYRNCQLTPEELTAILSTLISELTDNVNVRSGHDTTHADVASSEEEKTVVNPEWREKEKALKSRMVTISTGEFDGRKVSVWELLHSKYIPEEKRKELFHLYKSNILTIDQMETVVTSIVNKTEEQKENTSHVSDSQVGPREPETPDSSYYDLLQHTLRLENIDVTIREVHGQKASVWDPFFSRCVSNIRKEEILHRHGAPTVSVKESIRSVTTLITQTENPGDTSCKTGEIPKKNLMSPGTVKAPHTVETQNALKSRLINISVDKFHEQQFSIWDLLHSHYIPEEKRKELLQLYKSDMLTIDQVETVVTTIVNKTVEDKTNEQCCVTSPRQETRSSGEGQNVCFPHSISLEAMLQSERFVVPVGEFQGQMVSCWDLLFSKYISEDKQQDLLNKFKLKAVSVQDLIGILTNIITEAERHNRDQSASTESELIAAEGLGEKCEDLHARRLQLKKSLKTTMVQVTVGEYKGQKVCVLDLLFSKYVPQDKRQELLELYRAGTLPIQEMITIITTMIEEVESKCGKSNTKKKMSCKKGRVCWKDQDAQP